MRVRGVRRQVGAAALALVLAGCSWSTSEPGLFGRTSTRPSAGPTAQVLPAPRSIALPEPANPELPVRGAAVWTSGDGRDVTVRIAVNAVRRIEGGTVLDWSVTPLRALGRGPGESVPPTVDLGLSRIGAGTVDIFLIDGPGNRIFRPLSLRDDPRRCLCTPLTGVASNLRLGATTLLQLAFPSLPEDVATVDVDISTVPIFASVPVTAPGQVPLAIKPVDLTRPPPTPSAVARTRPFNYPASKQQFTISVDAAYTTPHWTSLSWRIRSLDAGDGVGAALDPPLVDADLPPDIDNRAAASGPQLRSGRTVHRARLITDRSPWNPGVDCLCTGLALWTNAMRGPGAEISVVTTYAPVDTDIVDVLIPGLTTVRGVRVTRAPVGDRPTASRAYRPDLWTAAEPLTGWPASAWPTPVPDSALISRYLGTIERFIDR